MGSGTLCVFDPTPTRPWHVFGWVVQIEFVRCSCGEWNEVLIAGCEVDGQTGGGVRACGVVGMDRAVSVNKGLQPVQIRAGVVLVVDLDADAEARGQLRGINSQLGCIGSERLIPETCIGDAPDGENYAD